MIEPTERLPAKISLVIPAYNEGEALGATLRELTAAAGSFGCETEIVVVNDGSSDDTARVLAEIPGLRVINHSRNRGYGASLKSGSRAATGEVVIFYDADGQHQPDKIVALLAALRDADMAVGARQSLFHSPAWRMPGKWVLGRLANYLANRDIPDLNSGFRAVRRPVLMQYLHLCPNKFSFTTTLTMALLAEGHEVNYIPIDVRPRKGRSTVTIKTGFETLLLLLRLITLFNPLRVFLPISVVLVLSGVLWSSFYVLHKRGLSVGGMLFILMGVLMFFSGLIADQVAAIRREMYRRD